MVRPPFVYYSTAAEYRRHYVQMYCRNVTITFDGIRIFFSPQRFDHAFYESVNRDGRKDVFSIARAQRIDWIKATLENQEAIVYEGWDKRTRIYDCTRRVSIVYGSFVVIVSLSLKRDGTLKGNFITCFQADNSIHKIRQSPEWTREKCLTRLQQKRQGYRREK